MQLVPLVRWPRLPVAVQKALHTEPLLNVLMTLDKDSRELAMKMLLECSSDLRREDCPRLKRRKGTPQRVPTDLAFADMESRYYATEDEGATLAITGRPGYRAAKCSERVMNSGKHCAEFRFTAAGGIHLDVMCGLAWPTLDASRTHCYRTSEFWGMFTGRASKGLVYHEGRGHDWQGCQVFGAGDVLRLLLDCDAGTLTVKKNGTLLGVAVTEGLTGDLCWAVAVHRADRVRIKAVDPAEF